MITRCALMLGFALAMAGCASTNPFNYTAGKLLDERHAKVCWSSVVTTANGRPCADEQAQASLDRCVNELEHAASPFTPEAEKREMLFDCMFDKGWQKTYVLAPPRT